MERHGHGGPGRWEGSIRPLLRRLLAPDPDSDDPVGGDRLLDLASAKSRLAAAALDLSLMAVVLHAFGALGPDLAFGGGTTPRLLVIAHLALWAVVLTVPVVLEGANGQTPGKQLMGIRVVGLETGRPVGFRTAAHRGAARALFWCVSFLALTDPLAQTLPDRSAGTIVIRAR